MNDAVRGANLIWLPLQHHCDLPPRRVVIAKAKVHNIRALLMVKSRVISSDQNSVYKCSATSHHIYG